MAGDLKTLARTAFKEKQYEDAIQYYSELCELEEQKGFTSENILYLVEYAEALFKNAVEKNDVFDRQQQQMLQSSDTYKEKYTLLEVDEEDVDDFEAAFDILERAKQIAADAEMSYDVLGKIEQLLADICFEDSNFQQALESYLNCCKLFEEANDYKKLAYTYYYVALVYEFANSPSETMDAKDSSIVNLPELERIKKAKEYVEKCLEILEKVDVGEDKEDLRQDITQKVQYINVA
eukprot:NODE_98_length_20568_cov_1.409546.p8 type:complete len:236 gc:universal NODE_98_length_20568_cov_1.409546:12420-11713(-)